MYTYSAAEPAAFNQGQCAGVRIGADGGIQIFQGSSTAVYIRNLATAVQGGDAEGAGAPEQSSIPAKPLGVNPFDPPKGEPADIAALLPFPQLDAILRYSHSDVFDDPDLDTLLRADKQFALDFSGSRFSYDHDPFDEDDYPDDKWQTSSGRNEILLKTVWGVYGYYRRSQKDAWVLNLKTDSRSAAFYRETMFF